MNTPIKVNKTYHDISINTSWFNDSMDEIIKISSSYVKPLSKIIDYGVGTGNSTLRIANKFQNYEKIYAIDNSTSWLNEAKNNLSNYFNIDFIKTNELKLYKEGIEKNSIDTVFSTNTIHLVKDIKKLFRTFYDLLKDDGKMFINSVNIRQNNNLHKIVFDEHNELIHNLCIDIFNKKSSALKISKEIINHNKQIRDLIFPKSRDITYYINALYQTKFKTVKSYVKNIKMYYKDWKELLLLSRLQKGIFPEITDNNIREKVLNEAIDILFDKLKEENGNDEYYLLDYTFIVACKYND